MIDKITGEVLNAMWQDLKEMGAIGIHETNGILRVQMSDMDTTGCEIKDHGKYDQACKNVGGVEFFTLIQKEVL